MTVIIETLKSYLSRFYLPTIRFNDVLEILLIAALLFLFMVWIQRTRAYSLLKGFLIVLAFLVLAALLNLSTILWITTRLAPYALLALVIIFQPELRKGLEQLGQRRFFSGFFSFGGSHETEQRFSDATLNEIVRATNEMSELRTGALIVIEGNIALTEFINTGITLDSVISSQLLVNIFEKNTPLHDGAVICREDRLVAATCYLPISENISLSKRYGTRHRAGLGISEVSDSFTIIVSEENGRISYAYLGSLVTGISVSDLREKLHLLQQNKLEAQTERRIGFLREGGTDEE